LERLPLACLLVVLAGCVDSESERAAMLEVAASRSAELEAALGDASVTDGLVIKLVFDVAVDLDLYVTDPLLETVYFANHRTQSGGELVADARCSTLETVEGIRREEVRFDAPYPGRYRVGVDFPERCDDGREPAGFAVSIAGAGVDQSLGGTVWLKQFDVVVLEFIVEG
jgi:hypothetical protein